MYLDRLGISAMCLVENILCSLTTQNKKPILCIFLQESTEILVGKKIEEKTIIDRVPIGSCPNTNQIQIPTHS